MSIKTLKTLDKALDAPEAHALLATGLKLASSFQQLTNGTIVLAGTVRKQPIEYTISASGNVFSNGFKARTVRGEYPLDQYRRALKAANELLTKRVG